MTGGNRMRWLAALSLVLLVGVGVLLERGRKNDVHRFNFAPEDAPGVAGFTRVSAHSNYASGIGYGWLDATGALETGSWPGDKTRTWESRDNLNVVSRRGPDDLARNHASGPVTFVLDVPPGRYEVWVLSGDSGHLEYLPHEPYRITVEGATTYDFAMTEEDFYRAFETPVMADDLTLEGIWRRHVAPRFQWRRTIVDVLDGQLEVKVVSPLRTAAVYDYIGDYAHTEVRNGPKRRYAGALNALVVLPFVQGESAGTSVIEAIDAWRRQNFGEKLPLQATAPRQVVGYTAADRVRGYMLFPVSPQQPLHPWETRAHKPETLRFRATPGEYVPVTFGLSPLQELGNTRVNFRWQKDESSGEQTVGPVDTDMRSGVVRYVARRADRDGQGWRPAPGMIVPADSWDIGPEVAKQFWFTYHVAEDAQPGHYHGQFMIQPEHGQPTTLDLEMEVLPFRLQRPTQLAVGMTYFSPVQYSYFGEQRFWERIAAEFADMRTHNMTTVQYTGLRIDDYARIGRALQQYREAGFEQPVYLLESYGLVSRLRRNGIPWESASFDEEYVRLIREFLQQADAREWPPVIINFGDEFTNSASEAIGARLARSLKSIPGIVTGADANGYREVMLLAPEVDILAFNNGWDGPDGVNRGRRLLNRETVELVRQAGATPWLVNIGIDRFSNGYWLWKMARLGIRGKIEWQYRGYNGMPYNSFDAQPLREHAVYPGPDGTAVPSIAYELMRIGLDDLAYLHTLEQALEKVREDPGKRAAVMRADAFIASLDSLIEDDMKKYSDADTRAKYAWPVVRFDALRSQVVDLILQLMY